MKLLSLLLLLLIEFSHAHPDAVLIERVETAFKDNLIDLLYIFYPPAEIQPTRVQLQLFSSDITVKNIKNVNNTDSDLAFICTKNDDCTYKDSSMIITYNLNVDFEEGKSHSTLLIFISSDDFSLFMALLDKLSYILYTKLTYFQRHNTSETRHRITLAIDTLETIPSKDDFVDAMDLVISWVSFFILIISKKCP